MYSLTVYVCTGMAAVIVIFIAISIFLVILLVAVLYKHGRQPASRQQESTYES